jgi:c-di-GMP-binding flagellar brake protein YcgR
MSFLDTQPSAPDTSDVAGAWARFQVQDPRQLLADLREACSTSVPVTIGAVGGGPTLPATLWSVDDVRAKLSFNVHSEDGEPTEAFDIRRLWAVCYLGDVKLQFPLARATFEGDASSRRLSADLPKTIFRLHRREGHRVRRAGDALGIVQFGTEAVGSAAPLRVSLADIGIGGCAFWLGVAAGPRWAVGDVLRPVEVSLPGEPIFKAGLSVRHVTNRAPSETLQRVGCAWMDLTPDSKAALMRAIEPGQRRRGLLSMTFTI